MIFADNIMNVGFYVDDELQGQFINRPLNNNTYDYRVPVFSISSLSPYVEHELVIQNGVVNGSQSLILLDYIMYSYVMSPSNFLRSITNSAFTAPRTLQNPHPLLHPV